MAASGPLVDILKSAMGMGADVPEEKTKDELAAMTKEERTAYHKARLVLKTQAKPADTEGLSKAEIRAKARAKQEEDRKRKDDATKTGSENKEALEELKLQGLTEEQAREVLNQLEQAKVADDEAESDEEDESLLGCVRTWMDQFDQPLSDSDSIRDFNLKVRFQGHVESTPPDHLGCILHVLVEKAFVDFDLAAVKQPAAVAKKVQPVVEKWACLCSYLYNKCDCLVAADIVVNSLKEGVLASCAEVSDATRDCALVGLLMSVREEVEGASDDDLLTSCRRLNSKSKVVQGFITFLEEAAEGSDGEDSD